MNVNGTSSSPRRKAGRPATGKDPMIGFRAPVGLLAEIDAYAKRNGLTRAAAIRRFVEAGLVDDV